ncbi:uncharacterized protein LOC108924483 [Scleropages formosus]|uniref:uncharacterized protein LOC108924483 n=1 Tax=Scleropages formosus TaxID=113540 RepID=UPI000878BBA3|nr:uncharacterized protein LOC108924483 [Scleropages formosus]
MSLCRHPSAKPMSKEVAKGPVPDVVLRSDSDSQKVQREHTRRSGEIEEEDAVEESERRVPDVEKDDLASRRARMNRSAPRLKQQFLPPACSNKDWEKWEGIRRASQQAALQQQALSEHEDVSPDAADIVTRKENPFVQPSREQDVDDGKEVEEERQKGGQGSSPQARPNVHKDDLARRRAQSGPVPHSDPLQTFVQASITQSDLEKWQRLKMTTEPSESELDTSSTVTRKESPFLQKWQGKEELVEEGGQEAGQGSRPQAQPAMQKDDLAQRRAQSGVPPNRDPLQAFIQASITQSDLEKWQRLKMTTELRCLLALHYAVPHLLNPLGVDALPTFDVCFQTESNYISPKRGAYLSLD